VIQGRALARVGVRYGEGFVGRPGEKGNGHIGPTGCA
jgi:hypothetical protein